MNISAAAASMRVILSFLIPVLLLSSAYFYFFALADVRKVLPKPLQDPISTRFAVDLFIWNSPVSARTRRSYLLSLTFGASAIGCAASLTFLYGSIGATVILSIIFGLAVVHILNRLRR